MGVVQFSGLSVVRARRLRETLGCANQVQVVFRTRFPPRHPE